MKRGKEICLGILVILLSIGFGGTLFTTEKVMAASVPDIKIAVVYPLSGALSRNGNLTLQGVGGLDGHQGGWLFAQNLDVSSGDHLAV